MNVGISTTWRALWGICAVLSRNYQNNLDLVKNIFVVPVEDIVVCMQDDRASKRFWGQVRFQNLCNLRFLATSVWLITWASEGFFSGRVHYWKWIVTKFFRGRAKSGEICFFLLETKKPSFFAEIFKVQVGPKSSLPSFPTPMCDSYLNLGKLSKLLLFHSTFLCESGFSTLLQVKIKIASDSTLQMILDALFPQRNQKLTIWSKTSQKSKNPTKVYLALSFVLLMLK